MDMASPTVIFVSMLVMQLWMTITASSETKDKDKKLCIHRPFM